MFENYIFHTVRYRVKDLNILDFKNGLYVNNYPYR